MFKKILLAPLVFFLSALSFAQVRDTAAIFGTVTDPQGAAIPNAVMNLTHVTTGQARSVNTSQTGEYLFNLLPVGTYRLDVETPGFRHYQRTGVLVHADENVKVDVALELGDVKSTVTVSAAASQVETRSVTIKDTVDAARVVELPLNGRDPGDLALLTPGTVSGEGGSSGSTGEGATIRGEKTFSMNGSRQNDVRFTLDGGINMDNLYNYGSPFPFPDAVQEFSVESSNMGFDHGNASSGAINIVTKSGTNQVHGDTFWFVRNTVMNASNFFSHQQDQLKQNQAGFTLGGPIKKNKLFAFGGWEDLQIRTASGASRALTLSKAEQTGDFSAPGEPTITDPLTSLPFPGNIVPPARLSKAAQNLLALTPPPQPNGFAYFSYNLPEHDYQYIGRADYTVNEKNNLMFRYFRSTQSLPYRSPPNNIFDAQAALSNLFDSGTLVYNLIVRPNLIARTQLTGVHQIGNDKSDLNTSMAALGVKVYAPSNDINVALTSSGIGYYTPSALYFARATEEFLHDWTWTKGKHTITWGGRLAWEQYNENTVFLDSGSYTFDGHVTGLDRADFMIGQMNFFEQVNGELENRRQPERGVYFGDTWRATPRFTISAGLRWEPYTFFTDTKNRNQTFFPQNYYAGIKTKVYVNAPPGLLYYGDVDPWGHRLGRSVAQSDLTNFGPRIGLAWDPFGDGKTSVRAAYGIYYDSPQLNQQNNSNDVTPFSYQVSFNNGLFDDPYAGREQYNVYPLKNFLPNTPYQNPLYTIVLDKKWLSPYSENWSFDVERQIFTDTRVRVAYIGTKGTHLYGDYNENPPIYNTSETLGQNLNDINGRRPFQGYQSIVKSMHGLNSSYNALQISVDKRFSHGFTVLGSYTWGKTLDYISENTYAAVALLQNPFDLFFRRGPSDQNLTHRVVASFVWDLPNVPNQSPTVAKAVLRNWKLSGIVTLQSGLPFSIPAAVDSLAFGIAYPGTTTGYADQLGASNPVLHHSSKGAEIAEYFDTSRFAQPGPNTYGTLGRNALVGPGYANMDASLVRAFRLSFLGEAGMLQFRWEGFNVFNRTNFNQPDTGTTSPTFGQLTSAGAARILQLAVKIVF